jgi:hypothetical protein
MRKMEATSLPDLVRVADRLALHTTKPYTAETTP